MRIPQSIRAIVETGPLGHLTTLNSDGSPQVAVVWVGVDVDEFVFGHMVEQQKLRNVRRDPRVALSFLGEKTNQIGLHEYVVVYGTAIVTEGGTADLLQRLAHTYLGPDVSFPPESVRDNPGFVMQLTPERFSGIGDWS